MSAPATIEDIARIERKIDALSAMLQQQAFGPPAAQDYEQEISMVLEQGIDPVEYLKSKNAIKKGKPCQRKARRSYRS